MARRLEVSEPTYHRWRDQFGGMKADDARRLRELSGQNAALKQLVADNELENLALREISRGTGEAVATTPRRGDHRSGHWGCTARLT